MITIDVSTWEDNDDLKEFRKEYNIDSTTWIFAMDTDDVMDKYGVEGVPTIVIIDKSGGVTYKKAGDLSAPIKMNFSPGKNC